MPPSFQTPNPPRPTNNLDIEVAIPTEILREIFLLYAGSSPSSAHTLCSVSRRWRSVAISFPDLWLDISSNVNIGYPPIPLLRIWIERSSTRLLDVNIESFLSYRHRKHLPLGGQEEYFRRVLDVLVPHCPRWRTLRLSLNYHAKLFEGLSLEHATKLKVVVLDLAFEENPPIDVVATIPSLKYFKWKSHVEGYFTDVAPSFPWEKLVYVDLSWGRGWEEMARAISQCTSASTIRLRGVIAFEEIELLPDAIILPCLRTLYLDGCYTDLLGLFSSLESPNLSVLRIRIDEYSDPEIADIHDPYYRLSSFLRSDKHNIQMLKVELATRPSEEDLLMILEACSAASIPSVEICVDLEGCGFRDFAWITERLKEVRIDDCQRDDVKMGWLNIRAIINFLSGFSKIPDVDIAEILPNFVLAPPQS